MYVAAFTAHWLCSYVVVGGGPYIRPGVLLMASWIVSGRNISLAHSALCALYYSLRRISMHPVAPPLMRKNLASALYCGVDGSLSKKTI
mgnify:CR=1 FL=1